MFLVLPRPKSTAPPVSHWLRPNGDHTFCNRRVYPDWRVVGVEDAPIICHRCQRIARDHAQWAAWDVPPAAGERS